MNSKIKLKEITHAVSDKNPSNKSLFERILIYFVHVEEEDTNNNISIITLKTKINLGLGES